MFRGHVADVCSNVILVGFYRNRITSPIERVTLSYCARLITCHAINLLMHCCCDIYMYHTRQLTYGLVL